jgi:hypothetical protein
VGLRLKLPWQVKFTLRALWLGGIVLVLGALLFAGFRPTTLPRTIGLVLMAGSGPFGILVFLYSWLRRRRTLARKARAARRSVPGVGTLATPGRAPRPAPVRAERPMPRRAVAAARR